MQQGKEHSNVTIERIAIKATRWIGSTNSLMIHTLLFIISFILYFFGIALEKILLVLTTLVSLEAIYLSIFIQMSVNRQARRLHAVARDVEEIQEDVEEIQEDVEEIQENVDEIAEDVDEIAEDVDEIAEDVDEIQENVEEIQEDVEGIEKDVDELAEEEDEAPLVKKDNDLVLERIEYTLGKLMNDIEELKKSHEPKKNITPRKTKGA